MTVAIRGFKDGRQLFEDLVDADTVDLAECAHHHALQLVDGPHMIEFEFLDEPDPNERFFRFGTDPRGMVLPFAFKLEPSDGP
jgi:hypothetical protein